MVGHITNETDLAKLKALSACESCDLSGANLSGAKYCKTQTPWGELNNDC